MSGAPERLEAAKHKRARRRTPPADVSVAGRPSLVLRDEDREALADALADTLIAAVDRDRLEFAEVAEKAAPPASSSRTNVAVSGSRSAR